MKPAAPSPQDPRDARDPWARLRLSIVAPLLATRLDRGELQAELEKLGSKLWKHPITGEPKRFAPSTIERWYYAIRGEDDPLHGLRRRLRADTGKTSSLSPAAQDALLAQYREHPGWSRELHHDNLVAKAKKDPSLGKIPSTSTIGRFFRARGLHRRRKPRTDTAEARRSAARFERLEVRSFEVSHVGALWHLDFHVCSRSVVTKTGARIRPVALGILDDRSRLFCHLQWYLHETAENLVHGLCQAIQKRGLPRALMTDNGAAMRAAETVRGLSELSIEHERTLCYAPYQNAKQESAWRTVEGRLVAMTEGDEALTLSRLNECTQVWVERDYHLRVHSEIQCTPLERFRQSPSVLRPSPDPERLRSAFCRRETRRQRRSDGSVSVQGVRFEVPSAFATLATLHLRFASWDLRQVDLVDPRTEAVLAQLRPQDKVARADGRRAPRASIGDPAAESPSTTHPGNEKSGVSALMQQMLDEARESGLPPQYLPKDERDEQHEEDGR